jgi:hypothetical protein
MVDDKMNQLVDDRLKKRPATGGYHPNAAPFKVVIHSNGGEPFIKREYTTQEKAERYALELSKKNKNLRITIEYIKV